MKHMKLLAAMALAFIVAFTAGCTSNPYVNQPDPAQTVAEKVGDSGIESRASSVNHDVDNATASQNFANIRSTNFSARRIVQQPDGTWVSFDLVDLSESDGKSGTGIEASYTRNVDGSVAIRVGKEAVLTDTELGKHISTDVRAQQLDTQDTTREGLNVGPGLQRSVDEPAIRYEEERTKRQGALLNAIPKATLPGIPGLSN